MPSLARRQGYLLRDEGGGANMPRPDGTPSSVHRIEAPTETCCHCNRVVIILTAPIRQALGLPPRSHPRGYCAKCDGYVCDLAICNQVCSPTMLLIDIARTHPEIPVFLRTKEGDMHPKLKDVLAQQGRIT